MTLSEHWQPYTPDATVPWTLRRAVHLHRRAGFAASWAELHRDLRDGPTINTGDAILLLIRRHPTGILFALPGPVLRKAIGATSIREESRDQVFDRFPYRRYCVLRSWRLFGAGHPFPVHADHQTEHR